MVCSIQRTYYVLCIVRIGSGRVVDYSSIIQINVLTVNPLIPHVSIDICHTLCSESEAYVVKSLPILSWLWFVSVVDMAPATVPPHE